MIVPTMNLEEIFREFTDDLKTLRNGKINYCLLDFRRVVLHTNRYPVRKAYECKTKHRNEIIMTLTANKRSDWKKPIENIYGTYMRDEGIYAVAGVDADADGKKIVYPPHYFKRYRERILKSDSIMPREVIRQHFLNETSILALNFNDAFKLVYEDFEGPVKHDDEVNFCCVSNNGYCFGKLEVGGRVAILTTVISEEMLFENQKPVFSRLRDIFNSHVAGVIGCDRKEIYRLINEVCVQYLIEKLSRDRADKI